MKFSLKIPIRYEDTNKIQTEFPRSGMHSRLENCNYFDTNIKRLNNKFIDISSSLKSSLQIK